jgi:XTP/dITP diphosphohydrolase
MAALPVRPQILWLPQNPVLVVGSRNLDKITEYQTLLDGIAPEIIDLNQLETRLGLSKNTLGNIAEPGITYEENASIKAEAITAAIKKSSAPDQHRYVVLADDSGLEVGSVRWLPLRLEDRKKNEITLLRERRSKRLAGLPYPGVDTAYVEKAAGSYEDIHACYLAAAAAGGGDRSLLAVTVIAAARPYDAKVLCFRGELHGRLSKHAVGETGFGYDFCFIPVGHTKTYAEMSLKEKLNISERRLALTHLINSLQVQGKASGPRAALT